MCSRKCHEGLDSVRDYRICSNRQTHLELRQKWNTYVVRDMLVDAGVRLNDAIRGFETGIPCWMDLFPKLRGWKGQIVAVNVAFKSPSVVESEPIADIINEVRIATPNLQLWYFLKNSTKVSRSELDTSSTSTEEIDGLPESQRPKLGFGHETGGDEICQSPKGVETQLKTAKQKTSLSRSTFSSRVKRRPGLNLNFWSNSFSSRTKNSTLPSNNN